MRAARHARLDHRAAVARVRADEVEHDLRALGERRQRGRIAHVGCDRLRLAHAELGEHPHRLRGVARRRRPAQAARPGTLIEIDRHLASRHAGRTQHHHVEVAAHRAHPISVAVVRVVCLQSRAPAADRDRSEVSRRLSRTQLPAAGPAPGASPRSARSPPPTAPTSTSASAARPPTAPSTTSSTTS